MQVSCTQTYRHLAGTVHLMALRTHCPWPVDLAHRPMHTPVSLSFHTFRWTLDGCSSEPASLVRTSAAQPPAAHSHAPLVSPWRRRLRTDDTHAPQGGLYFWSYIYYLSKFYEFFDTILNVLKVRYLLKQGQSPVPRIFDRRLLE